ncbi:MAG: FAD:protein FMN transferase [bacterium]
MKKCWVCCICLLLAVGCRETIEYEPYTKNKFLMDTYVRISVYDKNIQKNEIDNLLDSTFSVMQDLERDLSAHYRGGEIYRINQLADQKWVPISEPVYDCIKKCLQVAQLSSGNFDITIGVIKRHWSFNPDSAVIPDSLLIKQLLPQVDYRKINLSDSRKIRFEKSGMKIDLGGGAKGYILDQALTVLKKAGIDSVIIEGGGDFRISGYHPEHHKWRIGVRHPRKPGLKLAAIVETGPAGFATSGDYERFFIKNGIRYHHLLDPETGYPARHNISVTIIAETASKADALATAVFIMEPETGIEFIEKMEKTEGLIIYEKNNHDLQYKVSSGFSAKITL